ncbi:hypothetical protein TL16_g06673 [Triparma laevis f. inornata]|uniref:monoamine oxidase n=1 Tax=Triparma laevis f. inornata TaxID=1714386 RepID=A0A9W7ALL5_9STRA|nr:hypothetical protein TL16_g06673 [Triparma laevis f. inornata]
MNKPKVADISLDKVAEKTQAYWKMPKAPLNPDGFDCVVVGAGLSGLVCVQQLIDSPSAARIRSLHVIEFGEGVGGRLRSCEPPAGARSPAPAGVRSRAHTLSTAKPGIDLGAAWSWSSDKNVRKLARDMDIDTIEQPWEGKIVECNDGGRRTLRDARHGESPSGGGSVRFLDGGAAQICRKLKSEIEELRASNKIVWHFGTAVEAVGAIPETDEMEVLLSDETTITGLAVVFCCPPTAVAKIEMHPPLPEQRLQAMKLCQTWMSTTLKFSCIYEGKFWEEEELSGFGSLVFDEDDDAHIVETVWNNSDCQTFCIAGFARPPKDEDIEEGKVRKKIYDDLVLLLGENAREGRLDYVDWSRSLYNCDRFEEGTRQHREYGHLLLKQAHARRIIFGGTETENESGHMEGAIISGKRAANEAYQIMLGRRQSNKDALGNQYM